MISDVLNEAIKQIDEYLSWKNYRYKEGKFDPEIVRVRNEMYALRISLNTYWSGLNEEQKAAKKAYIQKIRDAEENVESCSMMDYFGAIGDFFKKHNLYINHRPEKRIVSFYRPSERNGNEIQLNFADGSSFVIFPDGLWAEYGPENTPGSDFAELGEPEIWPFALLKEGETDHKEPVMELKHEWYWRSEIQGLREIADRWERQLEQIKMQENGCETTIDET